MGARVGEFPWCDDFAAARNETLRLATGQWVLWMDADDRIDADNVAKLAAIVRGLGEEPAAYLMACVSLGPDGGPTFETPHVRLFRNRPTHRWVGRIHEQIAPSLARAGEELRPTDVAIHHLGYQERALFVRKLERNLRIIELECATQPGSGWLFYHRGGTLFDLGRHAEAIVDLHMAIPYVPPDMLGRTYALLAEAYAGDQQLGAALEQVRQGLAAVVVAPELWLAEAQMLAAQGEYRAAELSATSAMAYAGARGPLGILDVTVAPRARHLLARLALAQSRFDAAEQHARAVLSVRPAFGAAFLTLAEAMLARGDEAGFEAMAASMPETPDSRRGRALLAALREMDEGHPSRALTLLADASAQAPACFFLKKARLLALVGLKHPDSRSALTEVLRLSPLDVEARAAERALLAQTNLPDAARAVIRSYERFPTS